MTDIIKQTIQNANLDEICDPIEGDCESVAVALHRTFDAESFVCIYDPTINDHPVHATARINGQIYDGHGTRTMNGLIDHISYLKSSDFPDEITTPQEQQQEMKNALKEFSTDEYGTKLLSYDEQLVQKITIKLQNAKPT